MFGALCVKVQKWREQFAKWQAQDYLNRWLAVRLGDPKHTTYPWNLHGKGATWRRLMDGDNHDQLIAHTTVLHQGKKVLVAGWFSFSDIMSQEELRPPIHVHTAVLAYLPVSTDDWVCPPALFSNPTGFAQLAARF